MKLLQIQELKIVVKCVHWRRIIIIKSKVIIPELNDILNEIIHNVSVLKKMNDIRRDNHKDLIIISPRLQFVY
jgi:hypothetical protein